MNDSEITLELAKLELAEARQYERQRERLIAFAIVFSGGVAAAVLPNDSNETLDKILLALSAMFNLLILFFSLKLYTNFKVRYERYRGFREKLDQQNPGLKILQSIKKADQRFLSRGLYHPLTHIKLHVLWLIVPFLLLLGSSYAFFAVSG